MSGGADLPLVLIAPACPLIRSYPVERVMDVLAYLGNGGVDAGIALAILAAAALARNGRLARAGGAALLAVVVSGLLADLLKLVFQMPRPVEKLGYGLPSGHTSTAFALAGTFAQAFPAAAPFLYLIALLAGVARLYERAHFVQDVLGGGLLGTATAVLIGRRILGPARGPAPRVRPRWAWGAPVAFGVLALGFFGTY